ncbi:MAG TPA: CshA/CshB family fibrillar adhesin-related protein, partial [Jatrophihabitans sp.]|nr:CshA/CshB family fibrillar adhesin-related protein [Jatrophihabitans sp.]
VTDVGGNGVTGFALVGADAESTDNGESLTWTSDVNLESINPVGTACGNGFTGVGTTTVTCVGKTQGKTGDAMLAAENPSFLTQQMVGGGLQGFAFGVLVSKVQLAKSVVNGYAGDDFTVNVADADSNTVGTATTGPDGATASTGELTVLTGSNGRLHAERGRDARRPRELHPVLDLYAPRRTRQRRLGHVERREPRHRRLRKLRDHEHGDPGLDQRGQERRPNRHQQ